MDTTIFAEREHSNFAALLGAAIPTATNMLSGACFGDKACQENRTLQTQTGLVNAQANLTAAQAAALAQQNDGEQNKILMYLGIAFVVVIGIVAVIFLLKKQ